jgi:uncharacterized protein YjbI with pentapeptide repeats
MNARNLRNAIYVAVRSRTSFAASLLIAAALAITASSTRGPMAAQTALVINGCAIEPHTKCTRVDLHAASLSMANLQGAEMPNANLSHSDLQHSNLSDANLAMANLTQVNLNHANVVAAILIQANLREADLSQADLRYARLNNAEIVGTDLTGANLYQAVAPLALFSKAKLCRTIMPDGTLENKDC